MTGRREFLLRACGGASLLTALVRPVRAQQSSGAFRAVDSAGVRNADTTNTFVMNQDAYVPVHMPPRSGAAPRLDGAGVIALERRIRCQCGCTLDVYECRTSLYSCEVAPAMHRDVLELVAGGYSAEEIMDEFTNAYGSGVLMAPSAEGFDLLAWTAPVVAVAIAAVATAVEVRRWRAAARGTGGDA